VDSRHELASFISRPLNSISEKLIILRIFAVQTLK